jgi:hypothetical protein
MGRMASKLVPGRKLLFQEFIMTNTLVRLAKVETERVINEQD